MQASAGPAKKSKAASAGSGKAKKASDNKEILESELAVSVLLLGAQLHRPLTFNPPLPVLSSSRRCVKIWLLPFSQPPVCSSWTLLTGRTGWPAWRSSRR